MRFVNGVLSALIAVISTAAAAQGVPNFPRGPVRLIVPYAPGGATDTVARPLAEGLRERWRQPVMVDNRAGASGNIALDIAANAAPDGHMLLVGNVSTNAINESIFKTKTKPTRDLTGVTNLIELPHVWALSTAIRATTLREFVDYARKSANRLNYASAGVGSYPHLDTLVFLKHTGLTMTHVPYKGGAGQMIPALMSNEVQFMFINLGNSLAQIRAGRIKALATSWPMRRPELPDVPTVAEAGYPGMGTNAWNGLFAPAKISPALLKRIFNDVLELMAAPEMKETLAKATMSEVVSKSPGEFQKFVQEQAQKWNKVVLENNVKVE